MPKSQKLSKYHVFLIWSSSLVKECREVRKFFKDFNKRTAKKNWGITFEIIDHCLDSDPSERRGASTEELLKHAQDSLVLSFLLLDTQLEGSEATQQEAVQKYYKLIEESAEKTNFHEAQWFLKESPSGKLGRPLDEEISSSQDDLKDNLNKSISPELKEKLVQRWQLPSCLIPSQTQQIRRGYISFSESGDYKDLLIDHLTSRLSDASRPWTKTEKSTSSGIHEASRREKLAKIQELGIDPWGSRFDNHNPLMQIRSRENEIKETTDSKGQTHLEGPKVRAAGRIILQRRTGKLIFLDIRDRTEKIQLYIGKKQVGQEYWELAECFDLGDIIGVDGELRRTKTGELTIFVEKLHFLSKSIEPPPEKHKGLTDPELRQRMRYLDLAYSDGTLDRFLNRTKIVQSIRQTLASDGYYEIEGPTLHSIAGGAAARPFITHHNTLDMKLYMRIALELHLKRLLVGGMERVYELGRVYRNEGISPKHNPEFSMLEVYQAYGNYETMMDLTEQIILDALKSIGAPNKIPYGEAEIDFTPPFARKTYNELFTQHTSVDPSDDDGVNDLAKQLSIETSGKHPDVIRNEIFEEKVEDQLIGPIFVQDYPASICPLTKRKREDPAIAERFELFIQGMEVANAYTELNDPDLQEELFKTQLEGLSEEDSMAHMDHDFIRALRHGMPPAGGLGVGIDRLVMLLTNSPTIREVILFPLLRTETQ